MERFVIGYFPVQYVEERIDRNGVLTHGFSSELYPETREEFLAVIDAAVETYRYLETAVVEKAKAIIEQMKTEGVWVEDVKYEHHEKPIVVTFPEYNIPYDIVFADGQIEYKLILTRKGILGNDSDSWIRAQQILLSFAKPYSQRCIEQNHLPDHLPLCLYSTDFEKEAAEYIDEILDCHVLNFTHMSAKELTVVFEEKLGDLYRNHVKLYGELDAFK